MLTILEETVLGEEKVRVTEGRLLTRRKEETGRGRSAGRRKESRTDRGCPFLHLFTPPILLLPSETIN